MRLTKYIPLTLLILATLFVLRCDKDVGYYNPPSEIFNLKITNGDEMVSFTWSDPQNYDFEKIQISYLGSIAEVPKGIKFFQIDNLTNDSVYPILIQTFNYRGDKSEGVEVFGRPRGLPAIEWISEPQHSLEYSIHGYPNGYFNSQRNLRNTGSQGYITFYVKLIDLNANDTVTEISRTFLVGKNHDYTIFFRGKGDLTLTNCTECSIDSVSQRVEYNILEVPEMYYYEVPTCELIPVCANGKDKRSLQWNSIAKKDLHIEKITK